MAFLSIFNLIYFYRLKNIVLAHLEFFLKSLADFPLRGGGGAGRYPLFPAMFFFGKMIFP